MFKSRLFWKIFAGIWLSLVLTVAGVTGGLVIHNQARFDQANRIAQDPRAGFASRMVAATMDQGGEAVTRKLLENWPSRDANPPLVVDEHGADLLGRAVPPEMLARAREIASDDDSPRSIRSARSPSGVNYLVFQAGERGHHPDPPRIGPEIPLTLLIAALLASFLVSALLARHITRPIGQLRDAFDALASGKLNTRISKTMQRRSDEIGELGKDFDKMALQLEQLMAARDRLLHDVSHELRSPLARMQTAVGLAHQQPARIASALERIELEASRLDELVGELLTLARLESGKQAHGEEYIDLRELLASVVEDARFEADNSDRAIDLSDDLDREIILHASGTLLHRAFDNVIRNALHHTPVGTKVDVNLHADTVSGRLLISIRDHGEGIPPDQLEAVFEPFFRGSNNGAGGYGLGLAIARRAIEAHSGSIRAENVPGAGGLRMLIELPNGRTPKNHS